MDRPTLILRRFGAVSFGLGYFDGADWVDHTALPDGGRDLDIAGTTSTADRLALHAMLDCCELAADVPGSIEVVTVAAGRRSAHIAYGAGEAGVDAVVRRSSAL